jgi:hypothetical protein
MRRSLVVTVSLAGMLLVGTASPAQAMTVRRETSSYHATINWPCPGPDPVERYTLTTHTTTYSVDEQRVRVIDHAHRRGWLVDRDTGALIRDDANWTDVYTYRGRHLVRGVLTGAVWRLTIPGHGIVVHQTGRSVFGPGENSETPFGGQADISQLCAYV